MSLCHPVDLADEAAFALGAATIHPSSSEVEAQGRRIRLQPRVMQVLVALARKRGEVVSRDDLVAVCWGGLAVSEDAINRCIQRLRRLAESEVQGSFTIETLPRIGYRLTAMEATAAAQPASSFPLIGRRALVLGSTLGILAVAIAIIAALNLRIPDPANSVSPPYRSVALLPIRNRTGDPMMEDAAEALTRDANMFLGAGGYILVPPWNAILAFKNSVEDDRQTARALNVRFLVRAELGKAPPGYRVNYQIVDTIEGKLVETRDIGWPPAPPGSSPEARQSLKLFNAIAPFIDELWMADQMARPPDDRDPENLMARIQKIGLIDTRRADIPLVERLIATAEKIVPAKSGMMADLGVKACYYYLSLIENGYAESPEQRSSWAEKALAFGSNAMDLRPLLNAPHTCRARVFGLLERWDEGLAEARHVIELVPHSALGHEALASLEFGQGHFDRALAEYKETMELSDDGPLDVGIVDLFMGDETSAISELREQTVRAPEDSQGYFFLAAALEIAGHHDEALMQAALYRSHNPDAGPWARLNSSHEPVFVERAQLVRRALHETGLDEPGTHETPSR